MVSGADSEAAIAVADSDDAEEPDPLGEGDFVRWYRFEKAREAYEKENPRDVVKELGEKLSGPASSLFVLWLGFQAPSMAQSFGDFVRESGVLDK